jgi:nickel-dependent lactate racemase
LSGSAAAVTPEGQRLLDQRWRVEVDQPAELVIATVSGATGQTFAAVTQAFANAARVVQPGGKIVVLARAAEPMSPGFQAIRQLDSIAQALAHARHHKLPDAVRVWQLAHAAQFAKLYLHSDLPPATVEEMFMTPLEEARQVQKLIDQASSCLVLPDGHRTLAVVKKP